MKATPEFIAAAAAKREAYEAHRREWSAAWEQSDAEDWCARKEVHPGTYKPIGWL